MYINQWTYPEVAIKFSIIGYHSSITDSKVARNDIGFVATLSSEYMSDPNVAIISFTSRLLFGRYKVNTSKATKLCDDGYPLVGKRIENTDQLVGFWNRSYISTKEMTNFAVI